MVNQKKQRIIIALYGNGYSASVEGEPGITDWGSSPADALGRLVKKYPGAFGVEVVDKTATVATAE